MESVSRICLIELAFDLCADWKKLGYVFCLSNEVDRISQDYRKNVFEQAYRILLAWKQKNGSKATYQALGEALRRRTLTRTDLAEKYCEGGYQGSLKTGTVEENSLCLDYEQSLFPLKYSRGKRTSERAPKSPAAWIRECSATCTLGLTGASRTIRQAIFAHARSLCSFPPTILERKERLLVVYVVPY